MSTPGKLKNQPDHVAIKPATFALSQLSFEIVGLSLKLYFISTEKSPCKKRYIGASN